MQLETILTGLVVSGVTAVATSYVSGKIHAVEILHLQKELKRLDDEVKEVRKKLHDWSGLIGWLKVIIRERGIKLDEN